MFMNKILANLLIYSLSFTYLNNAFSNNDHFVLNPPPDCETPASIACIYSLVPEILGCPIATTTEVPSGGWGTIAVIENCHSQFAEDDLRVFSIQFGLPLCTTASGCFQQVLDPTSPATTPCTAAEYAADIEWAHAMAPHAKIIMVETTSERNGIILAAQYAGTLVAQAGGGFVSISYGEPEFSNETDYDHYFQAPGVVYIVSSGDYAAGARYPSSSPNVISAGGTSIIRDTQGNFLGEAAWFNPKKPSGEKLSGGTGGPSQYEKRPAFQNSVRKIVGSSRGTPDISFVSDPRTGVCVYATLNGINSGSWSKFGGTSVAAPALAGILNSANHRSQSTEEELNYIYNSALKNYHSFWHDIIEGSNGYPSLAGYDFVTGLGTPLGYRGK